MKIFQRLIAVCLLCCLLVSVAFTPVNASASAAAAAISIGLSSGAAITCPAWLLPFILAVVALYGLEYFGYPKIADVNLLDAIVAKAGEFSQRASATTQNWAKSVAAYIKSVTVIKYPEIFITEFNNHQDPDKKDWKFAAKFCVLLFGGSFLLDRAYKDGILKEESDLTAEQLAVANEQLIEINDQLNNIQNNIAQQNGFLSSIGSQLVNMRTSFESFFDHFQTTFSAIRTQMVGHFDQLVNTTSTFRNNFVTEIGTIENQLTALRSNFSDDMASARAVSAATLNTLKGVGTDFRTEIGTVQTQLSTIRNNFNDGISDLRAVSASTLNTLKTGVSTDLSSIADSLVNVETLLQTSMGGGNGNRPGVDTGFQDPSGGVQQSKDFLQNGENKLSLLYGQSNGVLEEYGTGVLAAGMIFKEFADIPFFANLLIVAASIGAVGILLGIALDVTSRESGRKTAEKMQRANKEGFNAGFKAGIEKAGG